MRGFRLAVYGRYQKTCFEKNNFKVSLIKIKQITRVSHTKNHIKIANKIKSTRVSCRLTFATVSNTQKQQQDPNFGTRSFLSLFLGLFGLPFDLVSSFRAWIFMVVLELLLLILRNEWTPLVRHRALAT